jgi:hypothetical protein
MSKNTKLTPAAPNETAEWWQWALSISEETTPFRGGDIIQKQDRPFFYLTGTGESNPGKEPIPRKLTISGEQANKEWLIPLFVGEFSTAEEPHATDDQLLARVKKEAQPKELKLIIDGDINYKLGPNREEWQQYYVESAPFEVNIPSNSVLGGNIASNTYRAVSAGYFAKLPPLDMGKKRTLTFGGTGDSFTTEVTYEVTRT